MLTRLLDDDPGDPAAGRRPASGRRHGRPDGDATWAPATPTTTGSARSPSRSTGDRCSTGRPSTLVGAPGADRRMQVIFEDVTAETRRHDLMEAYAGQVVLGQEEERRHIAQELHDGPLQTLIHLCRQIDARRRRRRPRAGRRGDRDRGAGRRCAPPSRTPSPSSGRSPGGCGRRCSTTWGWWPHQPGRDRGHRAPGVRELASTSTGRCAGCRRDVELAVFRIAQEAVTNVERHAGAGRVDRGAASSATAGSGSPVEDDGGGFDPHAPVGRTTASRSGLPGMSERARLVGGRLRVALPGRQGHDRRASGCRSSAARRA